MAKNPRKKRKTKGIYRSPSEISRAKVYINASFNNTIATVTDMAGNTLCWGTAGTAGFKGSRKSTPFAATTAVTQVANQALDMGVKEVEVYIKGPGPGRDASLRALKSAGLKLLLIADVTPMPHNGPRPRKPKRN